MKILVTGSAGFIGFHLSRHLLGLGHEVVGLDGMTPYYDVALKEARRELLTAERGFSDHLFLLEDADRLDGLVANAQPEIVVHLAAQAGVRYSLENPRAYLDSNLVGTFNLLEAVRRTGGVRHLLVASTSSVYGGNDQLPFVETERADWPLTFYAATKKANEAMSHAYAHLWRIPTTCFRFFTVYGPWGRPDMALFRFVAATLKGEPIDVYNGGDMLRDFTYVDDLVASVTALIDAVPEVGRPARGAQDSLSPVAPWRVVNVGYGEPVNLNDFIAAVEAALGRRVVRNELPMQKGDVPATFADAALLEALTGRRTPTSLAVGVKRFVDWYRGFYGTG